MYKIEYTIKFKKSYKRILKRGLDVRLFEDVINELRTTGKLQSKYKPHKLNSRFDYAWECHISPDWLLVWQQDDTTLTLLLLETGTHSDLFG